MLVKLKLVGTTFIAGCDERVLIRDHSLGCPINLICHVCGVGELRLILQV